MKVAIDVKPLKTEHNIRGIGSYTRNLIEALRQRGIGVVEFEDQNSIGSVDLIHYPYFDLFKMSLPWFKKFPTVVTIHDVIPLIFPKHYPPGLKGSFLNIFQKMSLGNTEAIITDSYSSKKDIQRRLGISESKTFPIYLAPSKQFRQIQNRETLKKVSKKYNLPRDFLVYFGDVNWNKNLINIASACDRLGIDLVMIGSNFSKTTTSAHPELIYFKEFLEKFKSNKHIHLKGFIEESDLICIINLAKGSILASFYEGFGLPIVESQACGTPVITSNTSSMPEVAGDGALYVDPFDVESIIDKIKLLLKDGFLRNKLTKKGLENVKRFSWSKTAEETVEVYKYVVNG